MLSFFFLFPLLFYCLLLIYSIIYHTTLAESASLITNQCTSFLLSSPTKLRSKITQLTRSRSGSPVSSSIVLSDAQLSAYSLDSFTIQWKHTIPSHFKSKLHSHSQSIQYSVKLYTIPKCDSNTIVSNSSISSVSTSVSTSNNITRCLEWEKTFIHPSNQSNSLSESVSYSVTNPPIGRLEVEIRLITPIIVSSATTAPTSASALSSSTVSTPCITFQLMNDLRILTFACLGPSPVTERSIEAFHLYFTRLSQFPTTNANPANGNTTTLVLDPSLYTTHFLTEICDFLDRYLSNHGLNTNTTEDSTIITMLQKFQFILSFWTPVRVATFFQSYSSSSSITIQQKRMKENELELLYSSLIRVAKRIRALALKSNINNVASISPSASDSPSSLSSSLPSSLTSLIATLYHLTLSLYHSASQSTHSATDLEFFVVHDAHHILTNLLAIYIETPTPSPSPSTSSLESSNTAIPFGSALEALMNLLELHYSLFSTADRDVLLGIFCRLSVKGIEPRDSREWKIKLQRFLDGSIHVKGNGNGNGNSVAAAAEANQSARQSVPSNGAAQLNQSSDSSSSSNVSSSSASLEEEIKVDQDADSSTVRQRRAGSAAASSRTRKSAKEKVQNQSAESEPGESEGAVSRRSRSKAGQATSGASDIEDATAAASKTRRTRGKKAKSSSEDSELEGE